MQLSLRKQHKESMSWNRSFERVNIIDKPLANLIRKGQKRLKVIQLAIKLAIIMYPAEIKKIVNIYFENFHSNRIENIEEMNRLLDAYELPKFDQIVIKF